ncbi:MAG: hypothetical protein U0470_06470 [Anaerolineae bacterium]
MPELGQDSIYRALQKAGVWDTSGVSAGAHGYAPDVAVGAGGDVCTAWQEQVDGGTGQPDIYLDCNVPGRRGVNLSGTANDRSVEPSVVFGAPRSGRWSRGASLQQSPDGSINFKPADQAAAPIAIGGPVSSPVIATIGGIVHAVWVKDDGAGGEDVYYGRFPSALATPTPSPTVSRTATATRPRMTPTATNTRLAPPSATPAEETPTPPRFTATPVATLDRVRGLIYLPHSIKPRGARSPDYGGGAGVAVTMSGRRGVTVRRAAAAPCPSGRGPERWGR